MNLIDDFSSHTSENDQFSGTDISENPERSTESKMIQANINKALDVLAPKERSVFVLRHYKDMSLKDIAEALSVAEGTVKSLLFRAIRRMRNELSFYRDDLGLEESC